MVVYLEYYLYLALVLIAFLISIHKIGLSRREDIVLSLLLISTFISELIAILLINKYKNNLIIYHIFSPIQFLLISIYFNDVIKSFKEKNTGIYIGISGIAISVINTLFIQHINVLNSYYILFEGIIIIAMILHFFYSIIQQDQQVLFRNKHVWIGMSLLLFWSITYSYWALSGGITEYAYEYMPVIARILRYVNIITYSSLSIIFLLNKKYILHNGD